MCITCFSAYGDPQLSFNNLIVPTEKNVILGLFMLGVQEEF